MRHPTPEQREYARHLAEVVADQRDLIRALRLQLQDKTFQLVRAHRYIQGVEGARCADRVNKLTGVK